MSVSPVNSPVISYIYYPSQKTLMGHCELEIEGNSYNLIKIDEFKESLMGDLRRNRKKDLSRMIEKTESKLGLPFFRFNISVTPNQLDELKKGISKISGITCSKGVANALKQHANFKIPMPLALFPSTSAIYLTLANKLGSRRVYQIESYSSNSLQKLSRVITGVVAETLVLAYTMLDSCYFSICSVEQYLVPEGYEYHGIFESCEIFSKPITSS